MTRDAAALGATTNRRSARERLFSADTTTIPRARWHIVPSAANACRVEAQVADIAKKHGWRLIPNRTPYMPCRQRRWIARLNCWRCLPELWCWYETECGETVVMAMTECGEAVVMATT